VCLLFCALSSHPAFAQDRAGEPEPHVTRSADDTRPIPDYDGRPEETPPEQALLWVPRILLSPLYLVTEFVLRRPLGWLTTEVERAELPRILIDFFTFDAEHKAGIVPTALVEFDFRASAGFYAWGDDFLADDNDLRIHGAIGGNDWFRLTIGDRIHLERDRSTLLLRAAAWTRPDQLYHGTGFDSAEELEARYGETRVEGLVEYEARVSGTPSGVRVSSGVRHSHYYADPDHGDPSVSDRVANGELPVPPGFRDLSSYTTRLDAVLDTRREAERDGSGTGLRLESYAEHGVDLARGDHWLRYGGAIGGYLDLTGDERVVSLSLAVDLADPLAGELPFSALVAYGGDMRLRGFRDGRLRGQSGAAMVLEYRWPIWAFLDGRIQLAAGNVFGPRFEGFSLERLRGSFAVGIAMTGDRDHAISALFGMGTETFEDGFEVSSFRLMVGTVSGF
jgi:hypothetical protein